MEISKSLKFVSVICLLLLGMIILPSSLLSRGNPIMVIELDCQLEDLRNNIGVRAVPRTIDCDESGNCPPGYTNPNPENEVCECEISCDFIQECESCEGEGGLDVYWVTDVNQSSQTVGFCGCEPDGFAFCGCPPWLTTVAGGGTQNNDICDIVEKPCYDGTLDVTVTQPVDCNNLDGEGRATANVRIALETMGACVGIVALENCELSSGENFVIALAEEFGATAAFCAEPDEDFIDLEFTFDPNGELPTWLYLIEGSEFDGDPLPLLSPDDLCQRAIPTLSTWMIITLGLIMAISGLVYVKRREVKAFMGMF